MRAVSRFFMCALVMMLVTYLVRAIPFTVFRRKVRNRFFRSFLYYVPYAVLTAMTLPAALYATGSMAVAAVGLLAAAVLAYRGKGLVVVSLAACAAAGLATCMIHLLG